MASNTTAFHEVRFPTEISRRASGGPERRTEIVTLGSGHEERNTRWAHSRRRYNAGLGIRSIDDIHTVIAFFEQRRGRLHGFRWKDHADFRSSPPMQTPAASDQLIAVGDGTMTSFQLIKHYGEGPQAYIRNIVKPVVGTIAIALNGVQADPATDFGVDETTGLVTFPADKTPSEGVEITAGFSFDVPVRFASDHLEISLAGFEAGALPDVSLIEVRL